MLAVSKIGDVFINDLPDPKDIEHFFTHYVEKEFSTGGADAAGFIIYGAEGTENNEYGKGRIDLSLNVFDDPDGKMCVRHCRNDGRSFDQYYSLGDESLFAEFFETRVESQISKGLFIPPGQAWLAVKDFIEQKGIRSDKVRWIHDIDLPDKALYKYDWADDE